MVRVAAEIHQIVTKIAAAPARRQPSRARCYHSHQVAIRCARTGKGRPSVSAVITDLVEKHRDELDAKLQ